MTVTAEAAVPTRRVVVIDDHPLIGIALVGSLQAVGLEATWYEPNSVDPAEVTGPDTLVLLDLDLGLDGQGLRLGGTGLLPELRATGARVLMVTGSTDELAVAAAVADGAIGWISKSVPFEDLLARIRDVAHGGPAITAEERDRLLALHESRTRQCRDLDRRWARLTPRELVVLDRLVEGQRAATIAAEFVVSMATVRTQIRSILAKLEVGSQLEAVALARQHA